MPRAVSHSIESVIEAAMHQFWQHGYHATSIDDLVTATGVSRHAIYASIGSKHELYRRGFAAYQAQIVSPAFGCVEEAGVGLPAICRFFETQIARAERAGLPGPGCFVANATTETAPHDRLIADEVAAHHARLRAGFAHALANESSDAISEEIAALADFLVLAAQGLWSMSRTVTSASPLRTQAATIMALLQARLKP